MDCAGVAREEILEGYLLGSLNAEDREAFEEHYFCCARCFDELQTLRDVRDELQLMRAEPPAPATHALRRWWPFVALAATVVLAVGVTVWVRSTSMRPSERTPIEKVLEAFDTEIASLRDGAKSSWQSQTKVSDQSNP